MTGPMRGLEKGVSIAYRTARCLAPDAAMAEELVLAAVARAAAERERLPAGADATVWFLRMFVLVAVSAAALPPEGFAAPAALPGTEISLDHILAAFAALPFEERLLTALSLSARLSVGELARIAALPVAGVQDRLHRGRRLLRQALGDQAVTAVSREERP